MRRSVWSMCLVLVLALCLPVAAETIPEDLYVVGKLCAGLGCDESVPPPSDVVLHLKDNNLKIKFEDTSTTAGFPSNDWQLTPNDSTNGGANKFSIEDLTGAKIPFTIMAGAATNSIFVDSTGRVGIGTASPSNSLHVSRSDGTAKLFVQESSGTTTARETAEFMNNGDVALVFKNSASNDRWAIGTGATDFVWNNQASANTEMQLNGSSGNLLIEGTLTQGSSRDIKTNFASLEPKDVLSRVTALPVSLWSYKTDGAVRHFGPVAEDFHQAFGLGANDKGIAPGDTAGVALAAIQGLHQVIQEKDEEIADLKDRLVALEKLVQGLAAHDKAMAEPEQ